MAEVALQCPVPEELVVEQPQVWRPGGGDTNSVYYDKNEGLWKCHHCIWTYKTGNSWVDHVNHKPFSRPSRDKNLGILDDINIPELMNAVVNSQNNENVADEDKTLSVSKASSCLTVKETNVGTSIKRVVANESDGDIDEVELEFERSLEKFHTHTPYCPKCNTQITKVVLRRRIKKKEKVVQRDDKQELLGCLSCFRVFNPSGGGSLNPFNIFRPKPKPDIQEKFEDQRKNPDGSTPGDVKDKKTVGSSEEEQLPADEPAGKLPVSSLHVPLLIGDMIINVGHGTGGDSGKKPIVSNEEGQLSADEPAGKLPVSSLHAPLLHGIQTHGDVIINVGDRTGNAGTDGSKSLEILRCIIYGGLMELIASLSVVSSAAASDTKTLNIIAIGFATVISSIFVFGNNLFDMQKERPSKNHSGEQELADRYEEHLGKRGNFVLHATFALLSFLVFGLVPPVVYGFASHESNNKDYKLIAVAAAAFSCVFVLAIGKAYVGRKKTLGGYVKTILYYMTMAVSASGVSYAAGDLAKILMDKFGWFETTPTPSNNVAAWASY